MAVQTEIQLTDDIIRSTIITGAHDGLDQNAIAAKFGHKKSWLNYWLKKLNLNWKDLKQAKVQEKSTNIQEVQSSKVQTSKKSKKPSPPKKAPLVLLDGDGGDDDPDQEGDIGEEITFEIPLQLKQMVKCSEYVCERIPRATFGDAIKFYEKTQMLENEQKDFVENNTLLGAFEEMVREYIHLLDEKPDPALVLY
jgi:hypothetical protein